MTPEAAIQMLQTCFWRRAEHLLFHHTNPWELDAALCDWGCSMGPCAAQDLIGLDKVLTPDWPGPILPRMVAEGRLGKISGVGFYRYPGGGGAVVDPLLEDLILEEAWFGKIKRIDLADDDLVTRMLACLDAPQRHLQEAGFGTAEIRNLLTKALHFPA
jgi:3-hydroxyacyl-CoA dehydrogenase